MNYNIAIIKGDGIGPEIVEQAIKVLDAIGNKYGHNFSYKYVEMGGAAYDKYGTPLPQETIDICMKCDSVLLGAVGGPKWDDLPGNLRPEAGLLGIRKALNLYANIRPAKLFTSLADSCPLRKDIAEKGIDLVVVRELTGGIYFGKRELNDNDAFDTMEYSQSEIERITRVAINLAGKRNNKICSVDKANVLDTSRLWRKVVHDICKSHSEIEIENMLVDNAAMQLVKDPSQFDVMLTSNMFGDILSDEAAAITGSLGMLPSASMGEGNFGLYEPSHGSAPDIAGKDIANPLATILSIAMMLRYSFNLIEEANAIENAVDSVLNDGYATNDIASQQSKIVGCSEMGDLILKYI